MVLSGMDLSNHAAHTGAIVTDNYEEVFSNEADLFVHLHNLYVCEPLAICANFVLALYDQDALLFQDSIRLFAAVAVEVKHSFVILALSLVPARIVPIVALECSMGGRGRVRRSTGSMHV